MQIQASSDCIDCQERERETQEAWLLDLLNTNILSDSRRVTLDFLTFS